MKQLPKAALLGIITTLLLNACGSDNKSDVETPPTPTPAPTPTPPSSALTWTQGVYEDASKFKDKCENPRSGQDQNGDNYADKEGSTLHEKHWLRSWSNDTYLWYNEIVDQDIAGFDDPISYFETLKTNAITESGSPRDKFHYTQDTADYEKLISGDATSSYGAKFILISSTAPREARVAYVEPGSPADLAGLKRGSEIISIDGKSFQYSNDIETLNAGLHPQKDGETHTFVVRHVREPYNRTVSLTAQTVTQYPVHNAGYFETDSGNIGYFTFNSFGTTTAELALFNTFKALSEKSVSDLIIDLRYNGGGYVSTSAQLGYMVAGEDITDGKTYEKMVFNDKHTSTNPITGKPISNVPFLSKTIGYSVTAGQDLPSVNLNRVFILSSARTCSASESLINGLRGVDVEVILIGDTTCGKPYGFYSTDNCGTTYSTIQVRGENEKGFGDYSDGFSPENIFSTAGERIQGCYVKDDFLHQLGDPDEAMLNAALTYRQNGSCPPISAIRPAQRTRNNSRDLLNDPRIIDNEIREQIRMDSLRFKEAGGQQ